ncbi:hypothetical protein [Flavobacterium sp.]|uniref:hypothetical protein n=1 Tax=Flavobacterium sp. TaxID=239 RepID=UPI003B9962FF
MEIVEIIIKALGLMSIGGVINYFFVESKKRKDQSRHEIKEVRYMAILLLSYSLVNYEKEKDKLKRQKPEITSKEELIDEIKLEWFNMTLYASDLVIKTMKKFIENPNEEALNKLVFVMRKSLYNVKTTLSPEDLSLD